MGCVGTHVWASYALKKAILIIDVENPSNVTELETPEELCAIASFGNQVWTGTLSSSIIIWDSLANKILQTIPNAHKKKINAFTNLPQKRIASCSDDGSIAVWSETSFELVNRIDAHSAKIKKVRLFDSSKKFQTPVVAKRAIPPNSPPANPVPVVSSHPGPSVPPGPGRKPPVPIARGNVAALQRNIVIPVPGGAPPMIKKPQPTPGPNPVPSTVNTPPPTPAEIGLFSCSWDKTIKKWDAENFNLKEQIGGYFSDEVSDFVFLFNQKIQCWTLIACGSGFDRSFVIWEMH